MVHLYIYFGNVQQVLSKAHVLQWRTEASVVHLPVPRQELVCRGVHFLAVQKNEDAEESAGLWLLQSRQLPKI